MSRPVMSRSDTHQGRKERPVTRVSQRGSVGRSRARTGPMIVACHWNILSPVGPAEQEDGGSRPRSTNSCNRKGCVSFLILSFQ